MSANSPKAPADYIWREQFWSALMEPRPERMLEHIKKARDTMNRRLEVLAIRKHRTAMLEYNAIRDAEVLLKTLERNHAMTIGSVQPHGEDEFYRRPAGGSDAAGF